MTGLPVLADLAAYRGDGWSQSFTFKSDPNTPLDLTGSTVVAKAYSSRFALQGPLDLDATVEDPTLGSVSISLPPGAPSGTFHYDVQVTDSGSKVTTWVHGQLIVDQDVST